MKRLVMTALTLSALAAAQAAIVKSPDGLTVVDVTEQNGKPVYTVSLDGVTFLNASPLGLDTNLGDYTSGLSLISSPEAVSVSDSYSLPNIKKSHVDYNANQRTYTFGRDGKKLFDVIFEVSNNNVAYRYKVYPVGGKDQTLCCVVNGEASGFAMPEGTTTFLCPMMKPMTGFARTAPSYETSYKVDQPVGENGWGAGYALPCLFKNGNNGWMLISETGVAGDYCSGRLVGSPDGVYSIDYPQHEEMNGMGSNGASISLPGYTPWRTITLGKTLAPIAETTIPFDVVRPLYEPSKKYEYGKGTWSWIIKMDPSCNFETQKQYIDFSHDLGYTSVLVDALWDTQIGREKVEELAKYGKSKGVDLLLWYNSNGSWNDAPQGPRNVMNDIVKRRKDMAWMQKMGVRGIKVDFFGSDKQEMMRLYHDILADANDYGLLVIFHGCTIPRGWERMYPNFAACEAVLASENLHFSQGSCDTEAFAATIHPLVRNTIGSMDFGGSALNKYYNANNTIGKGSKRITSDVFALSTAVLFQSALQHFALAPNNLTDAPAWAVDFMKAVPTTWDDTRFIEGYPGKYLVMARRNGDTWYLCGVNAGEPVNLTLTPEMLAPGKTFTLYSDDKDLNGSVKQGKADKKGRVKVSIPTGGAFVLMTSK